MRNAGGGGGHSNMVKPEGVGGSSDYSEGKGDNKYGTGGGGYGGGCACHYNNGKGGDGTVLIRYYAYRE